MWLDVRHVPRPNPDWRPRRINLLQRALPFTTSAAAFGLAVWHRTVYVAGLARGAFAGQSFAGAEGAFAAALSP